MVEAQIKRPSDTNLDGREFHKERRIPTPKDPNMDTILKAAGFSETDINLKLYRGPYALNKYKLDPSLFVGELSQHPERGNSPNYQTELTPSQEY